MATRAGPIPTAPSFLRGTIRTREPCFACHAEAYGRLGHSTLRHPVASHQSFPAHGPEPAAHFSNSFFFPRSYMDTRTQQQQITNLAEIFVQGMARIVDIQT